VAPKYQAHVVHRTEPFGLTASTLTAPRDPQPKDANETKRNYLGYLYFVPFILWSDLATKTLEMMLASGQIIGHRTGAWRLPGLLWT